VIDATAKREAPTTTEKRIARPLRVLAPLIQKELEQAKDAAAKAGLPYYRAAGSMMLEARLSYTDEQIAAGEFNAWIKRNFGIKKFQASQYMKFAEQAGLGAASALDATSLSDFIRRTSNPNYNRPTADETAEKVRRVDAEMLNFRQAEADRNAERDAERAMGLRVIEAGFKAVAREVHPDRGGSVEEMARLNKVRTRFKQYV
jgi:hypothetical protein